MSKRFDYFVVFAEMRTGSNFLEANINSFPALSCLGEAFNPHFIGYPNREDCLGVSEEARNREPHVLIEAVKNAQGLAGFRFFHDHEPRVLNDILNDPRCAKIILTRNPVESYVSWKIAQETGQWKLTNVAKRKDAQAVFDAKEFGAHLEALQAFQLRLMKALQTTGQTAFYVAYEDLQDVDVMNGLAAYLEQPDKLERLDRNLKRQNPEPLSKKVANFEEMEACLSKTDHFGLARTPNFEARRGAVRLRQAMWLARRRRSCFCPYALLLKTRYCLGWRRLTERMRPSFKAALAKKHCANGCGPIQATEVLAWFATLPHARTEHFVNEY